VRLQQGSPSKASLVAQFVMTDKKRQLGSATANKKNQIAVIAQSKKKQFIDWEALLAKIGAGNSIIEYGANREIFTQGDPADAVYYLKKGKAKLAVTSQQGKEAIVAVLSDGEFFGEGCLAGQLLRIASAIADCTLTKIEKALMARVLHEEHEISELFVTYLLSRNIRFEGDLIDQRSGSWALSSTRAAAA
jgi:CRP/FNR family cyclic AMP-dependent transcriptional regulator